MEIACCYASVGISAATGFVNCAQKAVVIRINHVLGMHNTTSRESAKRSNVRSCNLLCDNSELARAAVDHQTSAALSKRVQNFSAKGFDSRNSVRSRQNHRSNEILDLDPENNGGWLIPGALEEAADAERPCANDPQESSTEASSEDLTPSIDLRASGESMDSSGGEGSEAPLRIWAPGSRSISLGASPSVGMPFSLSRGSSCSDAAAAAEGKGRLSSPTQSAESDTDLISPVGFWQENFETIDARNATRKFSRWEDSCSVEEASLEERTGSGSSDGGGSGSSNLTGGKSGGNSASLRDVPRGQSDSAGGVDVGVGRKLFPSAERQRPPPVMTSSSQALAADLETMAEGDHEFPSPMGPLGGEAEAEAVPFWASAMEPAWDKLFGGIGRAERGAEEKESGGLGWRRGEAGLVVPEPLAPKSRSVTIQQVIQQCGSRTGDNPTAAGGAKKTITPPRPASASLAPPTGGVDESKAQPEPQTLSQGVRIVRSYSYHGLGSLALYDSANRGWVGATVFPFCSVPGITFHTPVLYQVVPTASALGGGTSYQKVAEGTLRLCILFFIHEKPSSCLPMREACGIVILSPPFA